jgi:outer membrane protein assembly factor BamB
LNGDITNNRLTGGPNEAAYRAARRTASIAAVFCLVVLLLLAANSVFSRMTDPVQPQQMVEMLHALNRAPRDEALKQRARRLDAQLRRNYFRGRAFTMTGLYLLLGGVVVFLLALEAAKQHRPSLPAPRAEAGREAWLSLAMGRRSAAALGLVLGGVLATLSVLSRHDAAVEYVKAAEKGGWYSLVTGVSPSPAGPLSLNTGEGVRATGLPPLGAAPASAVSPGIGSQGANSAGLQPPNNLPTPIPGNAVPPAGVAVPSVARASVPAITPPRSAGAPVAIASAFPPEWAQEWPVFRGPGGAGVATAKEAPTHWDGAKGEGIVWKTAVPLPGWNSPVAWGSRVFLSGADKSRREVYCFDADRGTLLWKMAAPLLPGGGKGEVKVMEDTGYAPSTMAADGKRVFAIFPNGDLFCLDFAGKPVWSRPLGTPENTYGHASSLTMYRSRLIVQFDQGSDLKEGKSALLALDAATGKTAWQTKRPAPSSWSTPIVIRTGKRDQIITCANPLVIAYDAATGAELWRAECLGGEVVPSPTFAGGAVIVACLGANMAAIRPDGTGNVTKTKVAWTASDNLPDIASPLGAGDLIFLATGDGMVTCVDAANGKKLWEHPYDTPTRSSPILVGRNVYLTDQKGVTHIFEAGRAFKEVGSASLGEEVQTTPAFAGGRVYIRGKQNLYCVGAK